MKISLAIGVFCGALGVLVMAGTAHAEPLSYRAVLDGKQLVPPVDVAATGEAEVQYDDANGSLVGTVTYDGLSSAPDGAELGKAACGAAGSVELPLSNPGATETAVNVTLTAAQGVDLAVGNLYVTIRTPAHPDGEIRGQFYFPRPEKKCVPGADAGDDGGSSSGGPPTGGPSPNGPLPGGGASDGGADAGSSGEAAPSTDDGGCSTTGSSSGSGLMVALAAAGLAAAGLASRGRRKRA